MIEQQEFLNVFYSLFEETERSDISMNTEFKQLAEWSSLITLCAIVAMEENFKKTLTAKEIDRAATVNDLYILMNS